MMLIVQALYLVDEPEEPKEQPRSHRKTCFVACSSMLDVSTPAPEGATQDTTPLMKNFYWQQVGIMCVPGGAMPDESDCSLHRQRNICHQPPSLAGKAASKKRGEQDRHAD